MPNNFDSSQKYFVYLHHDTISVPGLGVSLLNNNFGRKGHDGRRGHVLFRLLLQLMMCSTPQSASKGYARGLSTHPKWSFVLLRKYSPQETAGLRSNVSIDSRRLGTKAQDYALLLERPLQDHILSTSVEVGN